MCWKRLVLHNGNDFFWKKLYLPSTALSLVFLLQLFIKENPAVLVFSLAVTSTCSLCCFQSLYERMGVPFLSLCYSTGLNNRRAPNPNSSATAGEPPVPLISARPATSLCCQQAWSCKPAGQGSCANGIYFHLICEPHWCHLQEQPVMQKEKWGY